jgi:hypothetical protein
MDSEFWKYLYLFAFYWDCRSNSGNQTISLSKVQILQLTRV